MLSLFLVLTFLGCLSSGAILSMLLLLVGAYLSASLWLISHGVIYTGLLYVLVYVGAIVVLIMFVVQLTNTNLSGEYLNGSNSLILIQNTILIIISTVLFWIAYQNSIDYGLNGFNLSLNMMTLSNHSTYSYQFIQNLQNDLSFNNNNLTLLASSILNEYGYILVISVHAIILAVIGPIKLALSSQLN